jgi:hypothetical protein
MSARASTWAAVVVIALGAWLRLMGLFTCEVWADEAWWANKLVEGEVGWIRPPGYMWLTRQIIEVMNVEATLRSLSLIAGLVQLPLSFVLLRRLVHPWVAVAATFVFAVHPAAVGLTKEFKPYALESCLHTGLLLLAVHYLAQPRTRTLVALVAVAALAPPFSWSTVFLYPGLFLAVGWHALQERRRTDVIVAVAGVVATLAVLAIVCAMRLRDANPHPEYWGKAYGVFYLGDSAWGGIVWYLRKTGSLLAFPGAVRLWWNVIPQMNPVPLLLGACGLIVLLQRRAGPRAVTLRPLLFVLPWAVLLAFNLAGQWPYGTFRTNFFMLGYSLFLSAVGLDALYALAVRQHARAGLVVIGLTALLLAQALPVRPEVHRCKGAGSMAWHASVLRATELLREAIGTPAHDVTIAFDGQACSALTYYREHHSTARTTLQAWLVPPVRVRCSVGREAGWSQLLDELFASPDSFYVVVGKKSTGAMAAARLPKGCLRTAQHALPATWIYWCGRGTDPAPVFADEGNAP